MDYWTQFYVLFSFSLLHIACSSYSPDIYVCEPSQEDKDQIIAIHKEIRQIYLGKSSGSDLKEMKWDESLAKEAQDTAGACLDGRFQLGPNAIALLLYHNRDSEFHFKTEYPLEIILANKYLVGCGCTKCDDPHGDVYTQSYVCKYGSS